MSKVVGEVDQVLLKFHVKNELLRQMMAKLNEEMDKGLASKEEVKDSVKMLPAFVRSLPDGNEVGNFLALDLGGTNFRVILITLHGLNFLMTSEVFQIPKNIMLGEGVKLFDHIAACLSNFLHKICMQNNKLPLGFTFSFPCKQEDLASGRLINWTKGFKSSGVEGNDVVQMLKEAVSRRTDIEVEVVALLNDTVGTLMATGHIHHDCRIGVIIGTGTNACYMEKLSKCPKLAHLMKTPDDEMLINIEWGAFGDNGALSFLLNDYDKEVDATSINPGHQLFEKAISGMYIGELVRLVLRDLHKRKLLFAGQEIPKLAEPQSFPTKYASIVENENIAHSEEFSKTKKCLAKLGIKEPTEADCQIVAQVCRAISRRSASLCAAAIVALINRMNRPLVTIGCDGSVYKLHPAYKTQLESKIEDLLQSKNRYKLRLSEDGSGRGAALIAAVAARGMPQFEQSRILVTVERIVEEKMRQKKLAEQTELDSQEKTTGNVSPVQLGAGGVSSMNTIQSAEKAPVLRFQADVRSSADSAVSSVNSGSARGTPTPDSRFRNLASLETAETFADQAVRVSMAMKLQSLRSQAKNLGQDGKCEDGKGRICPVCMFGA